MQQNPFKMRGSDFLIVTAGVFAVIATVAAAADQTCFPDSDHCKCRKTKVGGTCLRPTGKAGDECIEYQCGEGAICDCLAGTEICSMTKCSTSSYTKLESAVPKSGGIVQCKKVERKLCVTLDRPGAAGDVCINDSNCPEGLICNAKNACATPAAAAGEPCKFDATCVSGLICNSADVCALPPAKAGEPCTSDAHCVSGLTCNSRNVCAVQSNIGGPCTTDAACVGDLICHTATSTCAKKIEFTMRANVDDWGWVQVGLGNGPETFFAYGTHDHAYTGTCGDMFITLGNDGSVDNPMSLVLEVTEGGVNYTLLPDSDPSPNKLTALVKYNARPFDHKKDASYDYSANGWKPAIKVLWNWWDNSPAQRALLGPGNDAPQLSVTTNAVTEPGLWMWKISLPFCASGFSKTAVPTVLNPLGASCTDGIGGDADCVVGLYCKAQICSTTP
jgi:hypothetical protein